MDQVGGNFSFDKGKKLNLDNFDGVSKEHLLKKAGNNAKQKALIESLFAKYDNGDGILSKAEFSAMQKELAVFAKDGNLGGRELKKFNKNLDADKKAYSMEDLQAVIGNMTDGTDDIAGVNELENGSLQIVRKPNEKGQEVTETFSNENNKLILLSDKVKDSNNDIISTVYRNGDRNNIDQQAIIKGDTATVTQFDDDGKTISARIRLKGSVEEVLDFEHNDRVLKKTTDKGNNTYETIEYEYADTGINPSKETLTKPDGTKLVTEYFEDDVLTVTELNAEGKTVGTVKMKGENVLSEEEYTYDEQGNVTILKTEGEGDDAVRTKTVQDTDGKVTQRVNVDAEGKAVETVHTVQPTDTWYGIVQAKYGVKDHKTTMAIVHELKRANGVKFSQKTMPATINLLPEVKVGNNTFEMKDVAAEASLIHHAPKQIDVSGIPKQIEKAAAKPGVAVPAKGKPIAEDKKQITFETFTPDLSKANQERVKGEDGRWYSYDAQGRVTEVFTKEPRDINEIFDNKDIKISYNSDGSLEWYQTFDHDAQGNLIGRTWYDKDGKADSYDVFENNANGQPTREIRYKAQTGLVKGCWDSEYDGEGKRTKLIQQEFENGKLTTTWVYSDYDEKGNYKYNVRYNSDNTVYIFDDCKYDENGRDISYNRYTKDGKFDGRWEYRYAQDGSKRELFYDKNGKLTEDNYTK